MDKPLYKHFGFSVGATIGKSSARFIKQLPLGRSMLHDCHVHTRHSGHSEDYSIKELMKTAGEKGVTIRLREHAPFPLEFFDSSRKWHYKFAGGLPAEKASLNAKTLPLFLAECAESGASLGFEMDILPGFEKETEGVINSLEKAAKEYGLCIDGINGSHHYYNGVVWDSSSEMLRSAMKRAEGCRKFFESYFGQTRDAIRTGFYDAISHLELLMQFNSPGSRLEKMLLKNKSAYADELEKTFSAAKECNVAIEYNTAGMDRACKAPFLSGYALHFAYHMGIPLVIGSDTHAVRHVGRHFDFGVRQLKEYGINQLHYFKKRERISYSI